jgi:2-(1,2-epoxy-1,2-dihydrophenyl)acetyl-CoA isomerase
MDRPEVLNSCNRPMVEQLAEAFTEAASDDRVRAVLLTGAGRAFCAGQDLAEVTPSDGSKPPDFGQVVQGYNRLIKAIRNLEKPVVAAVNGVAAGAGANIALACDFVIAADTASFIQAFIKIGLIPDNGGTFFLPRLVGTARATAAMMLGEKITAQQAKDWGMIYDVSPALTLMEAAGALAQNASLAHDLDSQLAVEAELQREAAHTRDYKEGVTAFQEKRVPSFFGH